MKKPLIIKTTIAFGLFAILILGILLFFKYKKANENETKHEHKEKKPLYTCPMHPQVLQEEPGTCPICFMDLVPVKSNENDKEENGDHDLEDKLIIRVSPSVIQKSGIVTEVAKKKTIQRDITSVAHVDYNESAEAIINSRVKGWIEKLYVRFTGKTVKKGQALAEIYSPELVSTQEEYLRLFQKQQSAPSKELAKEVDKLLSSARDRLLFWNISRAQIKKIETTGKVNRTLTIYSPYSGVVVEKKVIEGAYITEGTDLFKIIDLSTVWVFIHIPEQDIPFVEKGMKAKMTLSQIPGKVFHGKVSFIFPYMEMQSRDLKIRASFPNPNFELRPGMYATLSLKKKLPGKHIVISSSSVIRSGVRNIVFIHHGEGRFEPREVKIGVQDGNNGIQILEGLKEGDVVASSGQFLLDSETKLQEAIQKMRYSKGGQRH